MGVRLTPDVVRSSAAMIGLELLEDEVEVVRERLQSLLDATESFAHLAANTAEFDHRFDASWEDDQR